MILTENVIDSSLDYIYLNEEKVTISQYINIKIYNAIKRIFEFIGNAIKAFKNFIRKVSLSLPSIENKLKEYKESEIPVSIKYREPRVDVKSASIMYGRTLANMIDLSHIDDVCIEYCKRYKDRFSNVDDFDYMEVPYNILYKGNLTSEEERTLYNDPENGIGILEDMEDLYFKEEKDINSISKNAVFDCINSIKDSSINDAINRMEKFNKNGVTYQYYNDDLVKVLDREDVNMDYFNIVSNTCVFKMTRLIQVDLNNTKFYFNQCMSVIRAVKKAI